MNDGKKVSFIFGLGCQSSIESQSWQERIKATHGKMQGQAREKKAGCGRGERARDH